MTFANYIETKDPNITSEKRQVIETIAKACMVDVSTVYRWINGKCIPDPLKIQKISELTNIPVEQLFPEDTI